jgi:hypothetical protein
MKRRGVASPDQAEALLLAFYEGNNRVMDVEPISFGQANEFSNQGFSNSLVL